MHNRLDIDALIADRSVTTVVCCGSGGVGKTTTAAAFAIRAAEAGRKVAVLTIDPARRLAQALGVGDLTNDPSPVKAIRGTGSLDALMLDMKRTFDDVVLQHASGQKAQQILDNPFYQAVSSSFAGTQEYMAMERLAQLQAEKGPDGAAAWDLIVVDTPPSRSALDFLDAPKRLSSFLDGRFIRILMAPAKAGGKVYLKVMSAGLNTIAGVLSKIVGGQLLSDVQTFVAALDTMFGGFRERAEQTYAVLAAPSTAFLVVATPDREALREAAYFTQRLADDHMPLAGVVVNRVQPALVAGLSGPRALAAAAVMEEQPKRPGSGWQPMDTAGLLLLHAESETVRERHEAAIARFRAAQPELALVEVATQATDVNDLDQLREIGAELAR
ncbi:arsenite efflux ATP-binding protein ArsA [Branchiibius hedensis]|uniref:Anion-transporting ATPase, ArsA/GET3 family n=1 Tax=Branchiibius hedensis TaxID=672460 RepID=A0A2Y9C2L2_9MICO|nr:ArsA-related P-loop ATPase [Branchiibius hedensis]PWJ27463.1 arsenite efflux ATP-binding protein ArsA [Branchiibius hedensis]SSA36273.1 Anion-transporting ATPase, ArsA/GET3 family [Branchiibius hedensis]